MKSPHVSILALTIAAAMAPALQAQADTSAGYGRHFIPAFDNEVGANNLMLGVQELNGKLYCTGRGNGTVTTAPHTVVIRKLDGTKTGEFSQGTNTSTSAWGYRDGATDGTSLIFGYEGGIHVMNTSGTLATSVVAKNGAQTIVNPIVSKGITTTHRGLAYNPNGNGGKGSLMVGNFGASLEEIALDGTVLTTHTNGTGTTAWSVYGLAYDSNSGTTATFWVSTAPNAGDLVEYDWATAAPTGNRIARGVTGSQGGLSGYSGTDVNGEQVDFGLICMTQTTPDTITALRVDTYPGLAGESEPRLVSNVRSGTLDDASPKKFEAGQKVGFAWDKNTGTTCLYLIDAGTPVTNITLGMLLPELRRPGTVFGGIGAISTTLLEFTTPLGMPVGLQAAVQALYLEPKGNAPIAGVHASNQVMFEVAPPSNGVTVTTSGSNSFNSVTTSGFFSVENTGTKTITEVTFDWTGAVGQATMVFDTDQSGMADVFWYGNGTAISCSGTYRNGSDTACGLVYDATNTYLSAGTCTGANCGFIAAGGTGSSHKSVKFRYTSFGTAKKFEFDCDTDGGAGINGAAMAGMIVTIKFSDASTATGTLVATGATESKLTL